MATSRDDFGIAIRSALLQRGSRQKFSLFVLILISIAIFGLDNTQIKAVKSLRSLINDGERFVGHNFKGKYLDCGTMDGYIKSSMEISKLWKFVW